MWPFFVSWTLFSLFMWLASLFVLKGMYEHFVNDYEPSTPAIEYQREEDPTEREATQHFTINGVRDVYIQLPVQPTQLYVHPPVDNLED